MDDFNNKEFREHRTILKNESAYKSIFNIRRIYQVLFYISLVASIFIFIRLYDIDANALVWISIVVAYIFAYAVLMVLRALEHAINKINMLEQELSYKGIIESRQPVNKNDN